MQGCSKASACSAAKHAGLQSCMLSTVPDASCCCYVVVLDHHHVIEAHAMGCAAAQLHSPLVQQPQAWYCLAGVLNPVQDKPEQHTPTMLQPLLLVAQVASVGKHV